MFSRPKLPQRPTSKTISSETPPQPLEYEGGNNDDPNTEAGTSSPSGPSMHDILLLVGITVLLIWPWIFFGVIWALKGVRASNSFSKVVINHPHGTTYFVTLIGTIVSMIISTLFSLAIIRFAQEWVTHHSPTQVFHVTVLSAFRHQHWPWSMKDLHHLLDRKNWWPALLVAACIGTFTFVTSSTTSLLGPVPFNKTAPLTGTELNFSSTAADCLDWFTAHPINNNCDWQSYNGLEYTSCLGENQMVDILESGRGNILSLLPNNTQSLTFSQLGGEDGLHFLGSIRGVLPIGPNGVPAFNTLQPSPLSDPKLTAAMLSYDYTLEHQGFAINVSCDYATENPIVYQAIPNTNVAFTYSANCTELGGGDVLTNVNYLESVNGNNTLTFWACQSAPDGTENPSYLVYLRGVAHYTNSIGNITCTVSPMQPAIYPVTYQSIPGVFSTDEPISSSPNAFSGIIDNAFVGLSAIVEQAQNFEANEVAESVFTFGVKSFGLKPYVKDPQYLRLYEQMIQGILEYQATYIRLIYSTVSNPPSSCNRTVSGVLTYEVVGWSVQPEHIGYLMPMTIINLASLAVVLYAMRMAKRGGYKFDPTDPRPLIYAKRTGPKEAVPDEWKDSVTYQPFKLLKKAITGTMTKEAEQAVEQAAEEAAEKTAEQAVNDIEETSSNAASS